MVDIKDIVYGKKLIDEFIHKGELKKLIEKASEYVDIGSDQSLKLAIACCNKVLESGSSDEKFISIVLDLKGVAYAKLGCYEDAIKCYEELIKLNPIDAEAYRKMGDVFKHKNCFENAVECYEIAIQIDPTNMETLNNKCDVIYCLGKYEEALECLDRVLDTEGKSADTLCKKGNVHINLNQWEKAIRCFDEARNIDPNFVEICIEAYDKIIQINPQCSEAWNSKGDAVGSLGRYEDALEFFDKAIEIDPSDIHAWFHKSINLLDLSRDSEAYTAFLKAIELDKAKSCSLIKKLILMIKSENYTISNYTAENL
ncbi:MAG TPA: tetratricopeptide repeat protein [Methanothrix sp.]|nr:tetratricopeptide repeat protein [Methanothrix sp.]